MTDSTQSQQARSLAESYARIRETREKLEEQARLLKEKEAEAKAALITEMSAQGMPSVRFDGLGRFVIKPAVSYEVADIELLARAMLARMVDNGSHGRPLSDGLMLQKRAAKGEIEELIEMGYIDDGKLAELGLGRSERMDLTFTRQRP